jgi:hypothetical protein
VAETAVRRKDFGPLHGRLVWRGIVKVQRNLNPPQDTEVLIYSQDQKVFYQGPMIKELRQIFEGSWQQQPKMYCYAELRGTIIDVQRRVPDEEW